MFFFSFISFLSLYSQVNLVNTPTLHKLYKEIAKLCNKIIKNFNEYCNCHCKLLQLSPVTGSAVTVDFVYSSLNYMYIIVYPHVTVVWVDSSQMWV